MSSIFSFVSTFLNPHRLVNTTAAFLSLSTLASHAPTLPSKNLIIDTDLFSDIDDAAALALAATHLNTNILAINVNVHSTYSALAASALLNHYGYPNIPIGLPQPWTNDTFFDSWSYSLGEYASKIAFHHSGGSVPWGHIERARDPVTTYRETLASAEDQSVTIVSLGFLENISGLLNSTADAISPLNGSALVREKATELVVMGGGYPSGYEFNFWGGDPAHVVHVVDSWPGDVAMTFLGAEVGEQVKTGRRLMAEGPIGDPVRRGYEWYVGFNMSRFSWDPLTAVYACQGLGEWFEFGGEGGRNFVGVNGRNIWMEDGEGKTQRFLRLKEKNETVAMELEDMMLKAAWLGEERKEK